MNMKKFKSFLMLPLLALSLGACTSVINFNPNPDIENAAIVKSISFDQEVLELEVGQSYQLLTTIVTSDGSTVTASFKSSNSKVAMVSQDGVVTAVKSGTTNITAIAGLKMAKCKVVVTGEDIVLPNDISYLALTKQNVHLQPGQSEQLYYTTVPESAAVTIKFESNNEAVATVSASGNVVALAEGNATITVSYKELSATCEVIVSNTPYINDFTMSISSQAETLLIGGKVQLRVTTSAPATVSWRSNDSKVATVTTDGMVEGVGVGQTRIHASANDVDVSCLVTVTDGQGEEEEEDMDVTIYFFIDYNNTDMKDETGTMLLKKMKWYSEKPIRMSDVPTLTSAQAPDPAFPYFVGWSDHTIIDTKADLWNFDTDVVPYGTYTLKLYGIWMDTEAFNL